MTAPTRGSQGIARAFVAVYPPPAVVAALGTRVDAVRDEWPRLRWVRPEQWHLTLRFLGALPDAEALARALSAATAAVPACERVRLAGAGAFPSPRRASVLWVGVAEGTEALGRVAEAVEAACAAAGLAPEERPFHAHLTIARVNGSRDLRPLVAALGDEPVGPPFAVREVVLMASDTRPEGAVHSEVARFPLA